LSQSEGIQAEHFASRHEPQAVAPFRRVQKTGTLTLELMLGTSREQTLPRLRANAIIACIFKSCLKRFYMADPYCDRFLSASELLLDDRLAQLVGAPRARPTQWRPAVDGNIFNSNRVRVGQVIARKVFDPKGKQLYDLKGVNLYRPSRDLVGHLASAQGADKHLEKATDRLFSAS
jgi:hypothetical protein